MFLSRFIWILNLTLYVCTIALRYVHIYELFFHFVFFSFSTITLISLSINISIILRTEL